MMTLIWSRGYPSAITSSTARSAISSFAKVSLIN
jgi:hypothetical protein